MASTDAKPVPQKNVAYRVTFPILDADGDLVTGATGLDSEVSKDAGTFADCTNEATEIATNSGVYYLELTSTEMNADTVAIIVKTSSSGAKTTTIVMYPEEAGDIRVNATQINSVSAASVTTINANVGTTQPVNFTGTGASALAKSDMVDIAGAAVSTSTAQLGVNAVQAGGTAWGSGAITAAAFAADAITAAKIADGAIDAATFAAGAITASAFAADAITDAKVASDVTIASVTGAVGSVTGNVGGNVGGNVTGSVGSLATQAKADVNAEVVDALNVDTYAEPGQGAPAATASLAAKIGYLFKGWRNKVTQDATTYKLFADDATTVDQKATIADDGATLTRGEIASGP